MAKKQRKTKGDATPGPERANPLWGGRFQAGPAEIMARINASIDFDKRLYRQDLAGSRAHCNMLVAQGILKAGDGQKILKGLDRIEKEIEAGDFAYSAALEDIHMHVEARLAELIGPAAGRLHTARSRNDQVATDFRLWVRDALDRLDADVLALMHALVDRAEAEAATVMPGFTHLQSAQPVTFGHHLMRYAAALDNDLNRLAGAYARCNLSSLGGAAMAGTSWPVDRRRTAELLGHDDIAFNSSDAGGFARDYIEEAVAQLTLLMSDLGRLANDLYVWHSWEFGYLEVADGLAGTSSIMPQKKNPHSLERIKALGGQAAGWLPGVMACQHSVVSTDLDFTFADDLLTGMGDATLQSLRLATETVATLIVHEDRMARAAGAFWSTTSHLADDIVRRFDLPFRAAHHVVGRFVRDSIAAGLGPAEARSDDLAKAGQEMAGADIRIPDAELRDILDARAFLTSRASEGSVHPDQTRAHRAALADALGAHREQWAGRRTRTDEAVAGMLARARDLAGA